MEYKILITARLKSKRLKNKIIRKINKNQTIIEYIIKKLKKNFKNKNIILITSKNKQDDKLCKICKQQNIKFFRGSAIDVLKRINDTCQKFKFKNIITITADNPLIDIKNLKMLFNNHCKNNNDFSESIGMPVGTYGYCLKVSAVNKILKTKKIKDTEIWGDFFRKNKNFNCKKFFFKNYSDIKDLRLTVDYKKDLLLIRKILKISKNNYPTIDNIYKIWIKNNAIFEINKNLYQKKKFLSY